MSSVAGDVHAFAVCAFMDWFIIYFDQLNDVIKRLISFRFFKNTKKKEKKEKHKLKTVRK